MPKLVITRCIWAAITVAFGVDAIGQTPALPQASRTVYKCVVNKKTVYTDEPCLGASKIEVEPTRGLNKSTGEERVGRDVQRERMNEQVAEAIKPITGLNAQQFEVRRRRVYLSASIKLECERLDSSILEGELAERSTSGAAKVEIQESLLYSREQSRRLKC